jgi:hypothetical protein
MPDQRFITLIPEGHLATAAQADDRDIKEGEQKGRDADSNRKQTHGMSLFVKCKFIYTDVDKKSGAVKFFVEIRLVVLSGGLMMTGCENRSKPFEVCYNAQIMKKLAPLIKNALTEHHRGGVSASDCRACSSPCCSLGGFALLENVEHIYELYCQGKLIREDYVFPEGLNFEEFVFSYFDVDIQWADGEWLHEDLVLFRMRTLGPEGHVLDLSHFDDYPLERAALFDRNPWLNRGCVFLSEATAHWPRFDQQHQRHCLLHDDRSTTHITAKPLDCVYFTCQTPRQPKVADEDKRHAWFKMLSELYPNSVQRFQERLQEHTSNSDSA